VFDAAVIAMTPERKPAAEVDGRLLLGTARGMSTRHALLEAPVSRPGVYLPETPATGGVASTVPLRRLCVLARFSHVIGSDIQTAGQPNREAS